MTLRMRQHNLLLLQVLQQMATMASMRFITTVEVEDEAVTRAKAEEAIGAGEVLAVTSGVEDVAAAGVVEKATVAGAVLAATFVVAVAALLVSRSRSTPPSSHYSTFSTHESLSSRGFAVMLRAVDVSF
jgi:hypothetical protein